MAPETFWKDDPHRCGIRTFAEHAASRADPSHSGEHIAFAYEACIRYYQATGKPCCAACKWHGEAIQSGDDCGDCYAGPPLRTEHFRAAWPRTEAHEFCSHFEPRDDIHGAPVEREAQKPPNCIGSNRPLAGRFHLQSGPNLPIGSPVRPVGVDSQGYTLWAKCRASEAMGETRSIVKGDGTAYIRVFEHGPT